MLRTLRRARQFGFQFGDPRWHLRGLGQTRSISAIFDCTSASCEFSVIQRNRVPGRAR